MLHARIVPAVYAHARIVRIDRSAALEVPGVVAVLTAADLRLVGTGPQRRFEPLARDEIVYAGQPVALVVAESESAAGDAVGLVDVELEPLPPVVDLLAAMEPGAPLVRIIRVDNAEPSPSDEQDRDAEPVSANVFSRTRDRQGDTDAAFDRSDAVVEGRFTTAWAYQAYLEPQAATAWLEPDGTLAVTASTQALFATRNHLAALFGLPLSKVRVTGAPVGGAFGSKQTVIEPLVAAAALALRAPVRLELTRLEDFASTKPAQATVVDLRIGANRTGQLEALQARVVYDTGAYTESSWHMTAGLVITGPYRWPAFDVVGLGVQTNRFAAGNYRAPTGPQLTHALESLMDELAERLAIDPVELRMANLVGEGHRSTGSGEVWPRIGGVECLDELLRHPMWAGRASLPAGEGVGLAIGVWEASMEPAAATCRLEPDGTITVITGVMDISGVASGFAVIAAETFGVPVDAVHVVSADSSTAPPSPGSSGSAITYGSGLAVQQAVADARERFSRLAAEAFEMEPDDLEIVDGFVRPRGAPARGRSVAEIAAELSDGYAAPVEGHASTAHTAVAPSVAGHLAHVRVDDETGQVDLLDYVIVQDVGRAINPALVEDQMLGGVVQSIGRALHEALRHDEQGQLVTGSFLDYAVPRASWIPPIETIIVEVPAPEGPFGAKGIGEASILPGPAAIANAIAAAAGIRMRDLPITPAAVWAARRGRSG